MGKSKQPTGYQVCVHVGPRPEGISPSARFVELTVSEPTIESVVAAFAATDLAPGDFRAEAVCSLNTDRDTAVLVYAGLLGFAQRRVDVIAGGRIVAADKIDKLSRGIVDAGKPDPIPTQVQVGVSPHPELQSIVFASELSAADASAIRFARRVRFNPSSDVAAAITQFLVVAGIRARGNTERFPYLVDGTEPAPPVDDQLQVSGICLDTLRSNVLGLRRKHRSGDRRTQVERLPESSRVASLAAAAAVPIEDALRLLGGRQNPDTGLWHCPRPERHNNGDANASMRTVKGQVRCYRCDGERVDSLRLAMDVLGLSPDDAARWLTASVAAASASELENLFE